MIEAATRIRGVEQLIEMEQYFVIHAARQSGKTTYLKDLTERLNNEGSYYVLYCSLEGMQEVSGAETGIPLIVKKIKWTLQKNKFPKCETFAQDPDYSDFTGVLLNELNFYCEKLDKPLIILFDEVDCLSEGTLISFLRQLREGYVTKDMYPFVHSIALVGMRNIRDYKAKIRPDSQTLGSASPFNIVSETYTLQNFTKEEIASLYGQHTEETGQVFEKETVDLVYEQTCGQPWLVNAVAKEVIVNRLKNDYSKTITVEMAKEAIQTIILRRYSHIDSLLERLNEARVQRVIEPMISGDDFFDRLSDDYLYVTDLGLIKEIRGRIQPSNPIYGEVIIRTLSFNAQQELENKKPEFIITRYLKEGKINMTRLLTDFQQFWRENSAIWKEMVKYREAAPQLILQAFLQRVLNGGGDIKREMAAGTGRLDLGVVYEGSIYPIEVKLWKGEKYYRESLVQTARYVDIFGSKEGWLVLFDQRTGIPWEEKIFYKQETVNATVINVFGN